tara:strand:- start:1511 stop:2185 length:675 start_codon:yes stop_codon:yes gene_type:complete
MKKIKGYYIPENDEHFEGYFSKFDHYQEAQRNRALSHVEDWDTAIDIGANIGLWSKDFTAFFSRTICFEPNTSCLDCLKKNINISKAEIYNFALGSENTNGYLYCPKSTGGSSLINQTKYLGVDKLGNEIWDKFKVDTPKRKVNIKTLDSLELIDISFIKIDVQGYEFEVLKGSVDTLKKNNPIICIEEYKENLNESNEIDFLKSLNYCVIDRYMKEVILKKLN